MTINHIGRTERFKREFKKLSQANRAAFEKQIRKFFANPKPPFHPSLRIKKIQGTEHVFELTITMGVRMTFEFNGDTIILRNIGEHDKTFKNK
jgi:mRNA interferase RelE/StbE